MQVIPFLCVFILDGALFGDDVKNSCPAYNGHVSIEHRFNIY